ncbi:hypothetical protein C8J57DRAFT_1280465, partial [Mycena rebaudengoi]
MSDDKRTIASSPFDDTAADVIIRSSDNVHFYVYKLLLSLASPIFADIFTLPQPEDHRGSNSHQVAEVSESSETLYRLLSWCDPRSVPMASVEDVLAVLQAADKYCMDKVMKHAADILMLSSVHLEREPMKIFAVAVRYRLMEVAAVAAKYTLRFSWEEQMKQHVPELKAIPASITHQLGGYQLACKRAAAAVAAVPAVPALPGVSAAAVAATMIERISKERPAFKMFKIQSRFSNCPIGECFSSGQPWKGWFLQYLTAVKADLYDRPSVTTIDGRLLRESKLFALCPNCGEVNYAKLWELTQFLVQEVNQVLSEVPFVL